jgi:K+/H+ antiporter YhaU regulatory subunit KhtT
VGIVRKGSLVSNPETDFILMPDDLIAVIGDENQRKSFCEMTQDSNCSKVKKDKASVQIKV